MFSQERVATRAYDNSNSYLLYFLYVEMLKVDVSVRDLKDKMSGFILCSEEYKVSDSSGCSTNLSF